MIIKQSMLSFRRKILGPKSVCKKCLSVQMNLVVLVWSLNWHKYYRTSFAQIYTKSVNKSKTEDQNFIFNVVNI